MARPSGLSVRLKLTLSYAGLLVVAGTLLLLALWVLLLRSTRDGAPGGIVPNIMIRGDALTALRKRLGEPWLIATVPGVGYRIDAGGDDG